MRNSRDEKKFFLGVLAPSRDELKNVSGDWLLFFVIINLEGGDTMRKSRGEKNFLLGVLAPSRGELKTFSWGWLLLLVVLNLEGGGHHEKFSW